MAPDDYQVPGLLPHTGMPRISEFFGIVIANYFQDHTPPHFHALHAGAEVLVRIDTLEVISGALSRRARARVLEWAALHRAELSDDWDRACQGLPLAAIPPLDSAPFVVRVRRVVPLAGFNLRLDFTDGSSGVFDVGPFLRGPVFEPLLRDRALFLSVAVDPLLGTLVWPNGADLDPDVLRAETRFG